jgi:hypothetical protein
MTQATGRDLILARISSESVREATGRGRAGRRRGLSRYTSLV